MFISRCGPSIQFEALHNGREDIAVLTARRLLAELHRHLRLEPRRKLVEEFSLGREFVIELIHGVARDQGMIEFQLDGYCSRRSLQRSDAQRKAFGYRRTQQKK